MRSSIPAVIALASIALAFAAPINHNRTPRKFVGLDVHGAPVFLPMVGIGTWQYNSSYAGEAVKTAFSLGYEHVDTAFDYDNQVGIGEALKATGKKRSSYFITTKIPGGLNATTAVTNFKTNLEQLQTPYVDLLLVHFPATMDAAASGGKAGRQAEWKVLEQFYLSGHARAIGVSHYCERQLEDLFEIATVRPMVNQVQYHVGMGAPTTDGVNATDDKSFNEHHGVLYQSFSPLCGPCGTTELIDGDLVTSIAAKYAGADGSNVTGAQVSLKWQVQQGIPVIPKAHDVEFQRQNLDLFSWELSAEDMKELSAATSPAVAGGDAGPPATSGDCSIA